MGEEGMGVLDIFVFKASGLVKMDLTGLCDPYVTLTMTNDDGTGGGKVKRTKYIRQNLNPEFYPGIPVHGIQAFADAGDQGL